MSVRETFNICYLRKIDGGAIKKFYIRAGGLKTILRGCGMDLGPIPRCE
jgi:hypothetical protein